MSGQTGLFDDPCPLPVRHTDPPSSHEAIRKLEDSGRAQAQRATVLAMVKKRPGCTSMELAKEFKEDRVMVARRLSDLRDRFRAVRNGEKRFCEVSRIKGTLTWWAA